MTPAEPVEVNGSAGPKLAEALGYVARWAGKRVVIKFGGRAMTPEGAGTLITDVALLHAAGVRPVLVHGGGPEINELMTRLELPARFSEGLRVTDAATMRVVEMVLGGHVNKRLVGQLQRAGARAVGLSGKDGSLLEAQPHPRSAELGYVGLVKRVNTELLDTLLDGGFVPVVASLGAGPEGGTYNINADTAAAAIAVALSAEKFLLLTDVPGILGPEDETGERKLVSELNPESALELLQSGVVSQGMTPKLEACLTAVERSVPSAHILSAAVPHALLNELFTEAGVGTMVRPSGYSTKPFTTTPGSASQAGSPESKP